MSLCDWYFQQPSRRLKNLNKEKIYLYLPSCFSNIKRACGSSSKTSCKKACWEVCRKDTCSICFITHNSEEFSPCLEIWDKKILSQRDINGPKDSTMVGHLEDRNLTGSRDDQQIAEKGTSRASCAPMPVQRTLYPCTFVWKSNVKSIIWCSDHITENDITKQKKFTAEKRENLRHRWQPRSCKLKIATYFTICNYVIWARKNRSPIQLPQDPSTSQKKNKMIPR